MQNNGIIKPRKLSGFMELPPEKQIVFDDMKDKIRKTFLNNAFLPLDTPILELSEILLAKSGGDIDKELYRFSKGDTDICMRYDLTVPLARFVAMNSETLTFPFRRFQIGKVYRGEKAQKGRFREFYQCDADIIGQNELSLVADAECIKLLYEIYKNLGLDIVVHISNRNILFGFIESLKIANVSEVLTILDKVTKIGQDKAIQCLLEIGVSQENCKKLIQLSQKNGDFSKIIASVDNLCNNQTYQKGINELKELNRHLQSLNLPMNCCVLDLGIIRGQNYYTGTIFEAFLTGHPDFGAIGAGGRYDNLAEYFTDKKLPGVGMSVGLTRLFDLLDSNNMLPPVQSATTLALIPLGDNVDSCLNLVSRFRDMDISSEVLYEGSSFKSKLKHANKRQIPYVIIVGDDEIKAQRYTLKDMFSSSQSQLSFDECVNLIKNHEKS